MLEPGQWATPVPARPQAFDLFRREVDAVGEPGPIAQPARVFEIVERTASERVLAERVLVRGLREMGMQADALFFGETRGIAHDLPRHGERRAGGEGDPDERAFPRLVEGVDHPFAVGEDGLGVLDHGRGRQAAVLDRQVHGPARQHHPHPHVPGGRGLDVHSVFEPSREDVVVVRRGRAPGEQQLGERKSRRNVELIRGQPRPDRIEGLEPVEQLLAEGGAAGARQRLVEVVMRVDQSRQHDVPGGVEGVIAGRGGRGAGGQAFGDAVSLDDEAARRIAIG